MEAFFASCRVALDIAAVTGKELVGGGLRRGGKSVIQEMHGVALQLQPGTEILFCLIIGILVGGIDVGENFVLVNLVAEVRDDGQHDRDGRDNQAHGAFLPAFGSLGGFRQFKFGRHGATIALRFGRL